MEWSLKKIACGTILFEGTDIEKDCSFALYTNDKANSNRIKLMTSIKHPNVLNGIVLALRGKPPQIHHELALDPISGTMEHFVKMHFNVFFSPKTYVISDRFLKFLSGMIDAIGAVHHKGFFHGAVQKKNMLFHESDERDVRKQQVIDWRSLGWSIQSIRDDYIAVRTDNGTNGEGKRKVQDESNSSAYQDYTCVALNDLINILKNANEKKFIDVKDTALKSMPFQKLHERQRYMTVLVPEFTRCNASYGKMLDSHLGTLLECHGHLVVTHTCRR